MARRKQALTDVKIRKIKKAGRFTDGDGLDLMVTQGVDGFNRKWVCRLTIRGKRYERGIGPYPTVSLQQARETAVEYRRLAREGKDPRKAIADATAKKDAVPTFSEAAADVYDQNKSSWENAKHRQQWVNTLRDYAHPRIGGKRVDEIESNDILEVLEPIWLERPSTAKRVKQRIGLVLDWCITKRYRTTNPVDTVAKGLPRQRRTVRHMPAMPYQDVPEFMARLSRADQPIGSIALVFLILTACRTNDVRGARWSEIDVAKALWDIPAERMKMRERHVVPLSAQALAILDRVRPLKTSDEGLVFPSPSMPGKPLGPTTMLHALRRHGCEYTAHGWRATFRNWAGEQTTYPPRAIEACLAHRIKDQTELAYHRATYLDKRTTIMTDWANYLDPLGEAATKPADDSGAKVIQLRS